MIILDTSGFWAALDRRQPRHESCLEALLASQPPRLLSPFVLQELDHFFVQRLGLASELELLDEVVRGAYQLEAFDELDVRAARAVIARYNDLRVGLADASIVVLAERHRCLDILTLDHRHFGALRADGRAFQIAPVQ